MTSKEERLRSAEEIQRRERLRVLLSGALRAAEEALRRQRAEAERARREPKEG